MDSARRLYLYVLSGISLLLLTNAGVNLVGVLLDALALRLSDERLLAGAQDGVRQQVSVFASIALVSLPVWALHWWLIQRAVSASASAPAAGDDEHASTLRALYRAVVLMSCIIAVVVAAVNLLQRGLQHLLVSERVATAGSGTDVPRSLALLLIVGLVGAYHLRTMPPPPTHTLSGAAGWLGRLPELLALSIGLGMLLSGTARLIAVLVERAAWSGDLLHTAQTWERAGTDAGAVALIGLAVWTPLWLRRTRVHHADASDHRAVADRHANLWQLWLVLAPVVVLTIAAVMLHLALYETLQWLFLNEATLRGQDAISQLLRSLPALAIGGYLLWWTRSTARSGDDDDLGVQRAQWFGLAAPGLAMLGSGLVLLGMAVVDSTRDVDVLDGSNDWPRRALLRAIALTLVGLIVWAIGWLRGTALPGNATSRERRGYLLLVVGSALIVSLAASAVLLYTLLQRLLDATPSSGSSVSTSLLTLGVALPTLLIHALLWRSIPQAVPTRSTQPAPPRAVTVLPATSQHLRLRLPDDADAAAVLQELRRHLPPGATLDAVDLADDEGHGVPPR